MADTTIKVQFIGQLAAAGTTGLYRHGTVRREDWLLFDHQRVVSLAHHDVTLTTAGQWWVRFSALLAGGLGFGDVVQFDAMAGGSWVEGPSERVDSMATFAATISALRQLQEAWRRRHQPSSIMVFDNALRGLSNGRETFTAFQARQQAAMGVERQLPTSFLRFQQAQAKIWQRWLSRVPHLMTPVPSLTHVRAVTVLNRVSDPAPRLALLPEGKTVGLTAAQRHTLFRQWYQ